MLLKYAGGAICPPWLGPLDGPLSVCQVINNRASTAIAGRTMCPRQFDDGLVLASPLDSSAAVPRSGRFKRQDFEGHEDGGSRAYAIVASAVRSPSADRCKTR